MRITIFILLMAAISSCRTTKTTSSINLYNELYRPQLHFSPQKGWMNDPNGMVYHDGVYHLFYQYYPDSTVWGPMHWGHATSKNLVTWQEQPIALYPDSLGMIFSGSAVLDKGNTAGFGKNALVAIYTQHNAALAKEGSTQFENQSIAYSNNNGKTWTKYIANPVLKNPGIKDFRDPKVFWHEQSNKWVMALAVMDHIRFYTSPDLKNWKLESEFGKSLGAHGGVWECPDLFSLKDGNKEVWVLIVNLNPGGPNGGSATQYFVGDFDGNQFMPYDTATKWLDYGPDEYAGITWSNTSNRKIFYGWMSNWQYANVVPTKNWRSAMTIPRELALQEIGGKYFVASKPIRETYQQGVKKFAKQNIEAEKFSVTQAFGKLKSPAILHFSITPIKSFSVTLSNQLNEQLIVGFDAKTNHYLIDRRKSGQVNFEKGFAGKYIAPRFIDNKAITFTLVIDVASVELFADNGLTVMSAIFFPNEAYTDIVINSQESFVINLLEYDVLKGVWE